MSGRPVWLASVSRRRRGQIRATGTWTRRQFSEAENIAHRALSGAGAPQCERAFRMNITFCIHRALSAEEEESLPAEWCSAEGGLVGPPVEVLWSRGIDHTTAAMPCRAPSRLIIDPERPDLWVPEGCGKCDVCEARESAAKNGGNNGKH